MSVSNFYNKDEKLLFMDGISSEEIREILEDESIWRGYQSYNRLARQYGETDYVYLNSSEVKELKKKLDKKYKGIIHF